MIQSHFVCFFLLFNFFCRYIFIFINLFRKFCFQNAKKNTFYLTVIALNRAKKSIIPRSLLLRRRLNPFAFHAITRANGVMVVPTINAQNVTKMPSCTRRTILKIFATSETFLVKWKFRECIRKYISLLLLC